MRRRIHPQFQYAEVHHSSNNVWADSHTVRGQGPDCLALFLSLYCPDIASISCVMLTCSFKRKTDCLSQCAVLQRPAVLAPRTFGSTTSHRSFADQSFARTDACHAFLEITTCMRVILTRSLEELGDRLLAQAYNSGRHL
jgi:hypothetical protein